MRILDRDNIKVGLQDLGFGDEDFARFKTTDQTSQRHLAGHRPHRFGQDDHALRRAQRPEPARHQDHHGRGPRRVLPARREPVRGQGEDRDDLRSHHSGHAPAEPQHPPGRRNPGFGDRRDRNSGLADRTLGFQYIAHERCAQCYYTFGRYRHPAVPGRQLRACNHGATVGAESLSQMQDAIRAAARTFWPVWGCGPRSPRRPTS